MRTGEMWGIETYGVTPDALVTGKGLSGGIYPIAAVVVNEKAGKWLSEDGFGHMSSFGGAELGCLAAAKVLEICSRPETRSQVHYISAYLANGLRHVQQNYPDFFTGIRQRGIVMGLEFNHDQGAVYVMKHLYQNGIWAIFSTLDKRVLQFKPGLLIDREMCDEILTRLDASVGLAQAEVFGGRARSTMTSARPSYARQSAA
jgi:acetylornithine/succinyldiaminopimelate/putrescine aminotransferase